MKTIKITSGCRCEEPICYFLWEGWDGTCRRCGRDATHTLTQAATDDDDDLPLVMGGQGRSDEETRAIGGLVWWIAAAAVALGAAILFGGRDQ